MRMKWTAPLLFLQTVAASARGLTAGDAPAPAVAAAPGPGPAPELPGLDTLHLKFEIRNYNYFDLTKETCPEKINRKKKIHTHKEVVAAEKVEAKAEDTAEKKIEEKVEKKEDKKADDKADKAVVEKKEPPSVAHSSGLPWMADKGKKKPPPAKPVDTKPPPSSDAAVDVNNAIDEVHGNSDNIAKQIQKGLGNFGAKDAPKPPWVDKKDGKASFVQLDSSYAAIDSCVAERSSLGETTSMECTTIMDVLRKTIKETVKGVITCLYLRSIAGPSPGPAPSPFALPPVAPASLLPSAPAAASFLHLKAPAPVPAPSPSGPVMPDVNIFVTFSQGRKIANPRIGGYSIMVEIAFLDTPGNGIDDVAAARPFLETAIHFASQDLLSKHVQPHAAGEDGYLKNQLMHALKAVTGIKPSLKNVEIESEMINQWNINKCEKHIKGIVDEFTLHYTRDQVPNALYNECTNFMTKMSFSHDYVLDPMDTTRCRRATKKFAKHWKYGKNADEKDFEEMCLNACEAKYGRNAPTCNIHVGKKMINKPSL
jgi:hypothetical protein